MLPLLVKLRVPVTVLAASEVARELTKVTLLAVVKPTPLANTFEALLRVILFADPAANVAAPVTFIARVCVSAPPVVTPKVPATDPIFNSSAFASCSCILLPLAILTVVKLLPELPKLMSPAPAEIVASPLTLMPAV